MVLGLLWVLVGCHAGGGPAAAAEGVAAPALDPKAGSEIGWVFEAWMTPHQEGAEEADTPKGVPAQFKSTTPSLTRAEREAAGHRGHGVIRFTRDLSRAYVDVAIEGVDPASINMFHVHCGKPGILGPILVDLGHERDLGAVMRGGALQMTVTNAEITATVAHGHGLVGVLTAGCTIPSPTLEGPGPVKVSTVAGMFDLARSGDLYFNLHTTGQTYYGDLRGQLYPARDE
jgi:hypothetical protein